MARVGRFATCKVSTPSSGAEGCGAGAGGTGAFSRGAAARGRRVVSSSGRLPTHDAATASTARRRFAGGSAGALQSGISSSESSESSDMGAGDGCRWQLDLCSGAPMAAGWQIVVGLLWAYYDDVLTANRAALPCSGKKLASVV